MTISDPIADLLTRVRNGVMARHRFTDIRYSKVKQNIIEILKAQGFIDNFMVKREGVKVTIRIMLKYKTGRASVINGLKRVSKPSCRKYVGYQEIPRVLGGMGIAILSTPQGVLFGDEARKRKVGGELLCYVW